MKKRNLEVTNKRYKLISKFVKSNKLTLTANNYPESNPHDPDGYYDGNYEIGYYDCLWAECYLHSFWNLGWWIKFLHNPNENWDYDKMDEINKVRKLNTYQHDQEYRDHFW